MKKRTKDDRLKEKKKTVERIDGKAKRWGTPAAPILDHRGNTWNRSLCTFQW
jgi:hypothetical protein